MKQTIKRIIIEKQREIPRYRLVERNVQFGDKTNYVIVGLRRAGKSYMLYQDIQKRVKSGTIGIEDIIYINFEDERLAGMKSEQLGEIIDAYSELYENQRPYIYLDEIQNVDGWEKFARRLADSKYRVIITGSNAKMLSREIASTLGGRYIPREMFPFSFKEYLDYHGVAIDRNWEYDPQMKSAVIRLFNRYFHEGGIAESFEQEDKREYLNALYQKILLGDIVERNHIRNPRVFRFLARKIADSVMQPSSLTRLQHMVKSTGDTISLPALKDYLGYMEDAYLVFAIPNLASPMTEQATISKRYLADNGLLNLFLYDGETKLLENLVAISLNRKYRGSEDEPAVYYYNRNIEVDFCIPSEKLAIQVSYNISDTATREREVGALLKFTNAFPGYKGIIITNDSEEHIETETGTIEVVPVWKWLLM